jgi:membrane protease YdiL (CAAX protease family)
MYAIDYANPWVRAAGGAARKLPVWAILPAAIAILATALLGGAVVYEPLSAVAPALPEAVFHLDAQPGRPLLFHVPALCRATPDQRPVGAPTRAGIELRPGARDRCRRWRGRAGCRRGARAHRGSGGVESGDEPALALGVGGLLLSAVLWLVPVGAEEVFFRGWLQPVLALRWGPWVGLLATSLLFSLAHAALKPIGPLAVLNGVLAGLLFGLLAMRTGTLWAPVAAHWAWNWGEQAVAGASPNPGLDSLGAVVDLNLVGSTWLSGGDDALNGALGATLSLGAACLLLMLQGPRRD